MLLPPTTGPNACGAAGCGYDDLLTIIDEMGSASATAQKLPQVITTAERLKHSNHRLYLLRDLRANGCVVLGIIKVGEKKLFLYDNTSRLQEREPTCVLDFYVHESCQRTGLGRLLYDYMIAAEDVQPHQLAVDRPSHKFFSFLARHFQLKNYHPQPNNFVVFREFFSQNRLGAGASRDSDSNSNTPKPQAPVAEDLRSPVPAMNPPSRFARGTPSSQMKTSSGLSAAMGYTPRITR